MLDKNFSMTPNTPDVIKASKYQRMQIIQLAATLQDTAEELSKLNNVRGEKLETASFLIMQAEKSLALFKKNCLDKT